MKSKTTAALLAFLFGGFGVHRFYLSQIGLGFLYLLFIWTLVPIIAAFIDFIIFLTMSDEAFNAKYNKGDTPSPPISMNTATELEKLFDLKEKGVLTDDEFEQRKRKLL